MTDVDLIVLVLCILVGAVFWLAIGLYDRAERTELASPFRRAGKK